MVALLTRKTAFAAGVFAIIAYAGYKEDIFDVDATKNKAYWDAAEKAGTAAVKTAVAKRKAKKAT